MRIVSRSKQGNPCLFARKRKKKVWDVLPIKTQHCVVVWHCTVHAGSRGIIVITSLFPVRWICLIIPIITWNIPICTRVAILPSLIALLMLISIPVKYTLHSPYTLLHKQTWMRIIIHSQNYQKQHQLDKSYNQLKICTVEASFAIESSYWDTSDYKI